MSWAKAVSACRSGLGGVGHHQRQLERAGDQGAGLHALHPRHCAQIVTHAQKIDHLAAGHAPCARRDRQAAHQLGPYGAVRVGVRVGHDLEGTVCSASPASTAVASS